MYLLSAARVIVEVSFQKCEEVNDRKQLSGARNNTLFLHEEHELCCTEERSQNNSRWEENPSTFKVGEVGETRV